MCSLFRGATKHMHAHMEFFWFFCYAESMFLNGQEVEVKPRSCGRWGGRAAVGFSSFPGSF